MTKAASKPGEVRAVCVQRPQILEGEPPQGLKCWVLAPPASWRLHTVLRSVGTCVAETSARRL